MGVLQEDKAVFYHPLNDVWEYKVPSTAWTKSSGSLAGSGKVGKALSREDIAADVSGDTGDYASAAAATKVAFCGWFTKPSSTPSQTAAPTVGTPIGDAATSCSGTGVNGATVEVFVDDVSVGNADAAVAGGTWSKTGMAALSTGEVVSAEQRSTGELQSAESNEVTVQAYSAAPTTDSPINGGATSCSGTGVNGATVEVFVDDVSVGNADAVVSGGTWAKTGMSALSIGDVVSSKQTEPGKLQGAESNEVTVEVGGPTFGAQVEFDNVGCDATAVCNIDSTRVLVVYASDTNNCKGKVGTVSGSGITFGSDVSFGNTAGEGWVSCDKLSSSAAVVMWKEGATYARCAIAVISGTTVTCPGGTSTIFSGNMSYPRVSVLDSTHFVGVAREGTSNGRARVGVTDGNSITGWGTLQEFHGSNAMYTNVAAISSSKFVVSYSEVGASWAGRARVGTVSGGTNISYGSVYTWKASNAYYDVSMANLGDGEHVLHATGDQGSNNTGVSVATVAGGGTGTTVSFGARAEYQNHVVDTAIAALSTTKIMVVGRDGFDGNAAKVRQGDVSGTTISFGGLSGGLGGSSQKYGVAAISSTQAVATYKDVDDSNHPNANVVTTV